MHEHIFIESIIKQVPDPNNVVSISLELGELVAIEPEHLKEHLSERSDWKIEIIKKPSLVKCPCGYNGPAKIMQRLHDLVIYECPNCHNIPEVIEGKTIKILKITYK